MPSTDPTVRLSITVPSSLYGELEELIAAGAAVNRSQALTDALRLWLTRQREELLKSAARRLSDADVPDADYQALREP